MFENLKLNDDGERVIILQEKLKMLGFYNAVITGSFGLATLEGVKAFQRETGLDSTGVVNNATWERLIQYTEPIIAPISVYPNLSMGSSGSYVTDLQTKLKALLYYTGAVNGNFDLETENAVKRFQLNNKLTADGIVGSKTWNSLNSLYGNLNDCAIENGSGNNNNNNTGNNITYTVKAGDTLYGIARQYNTTVDAIKSLNNLTSDILQIGQVLSIPTSSSNNNNNYLRYTVVSGDTLYGIALRFNTTVDAIKNLNNLTSNLLSIGQVLLIPTINNQQSYINYVVERGDTIYSIALRYNTSVNEIKRLNNLTSNTLIIGQVLKIPTSGNNNYITYRVVSGDTLFGIARTYNTTVDAIKKLNNLTSNILQIGQILRIPV